MAGSEPIFDFEGFYRALNATREARRLNWKQVGDEAAIGASTLTRMGQNKRPDADGLAALSAWAGINPADYVATTSKAAGPEPLAEISKALRRDPKLEPEDAAAIEDIVKAAYARLRKADVKR